jgi:hypothetical protein
MALLRTGGKAGKRQVVPQGTVVFNTYKNFTNAYNGPRLSFLLKDKKQARTGILS